MKALVREGAYSPNLEESCKKFSPDFRRQPHPTMEFYILKHENPDYELGVSQPLNHPPTDFAVSFSIVSDSDKTNRQVAEEFQRKSGIRLRRMPGPVELRMIQVILGTEN
jgi:hypothetical protein